VHRAGRSGRAGVKGKAFTFLTSEDEEIFYDVRVFLERNEFKVPEVLMEHPAAQIKPGVLAQISRRKQVVYAN
jgi:ATP-dependent RNA helicase DDX23/PRP28